MSIEDYTISFDGIHFHDNVPSTQYRSENLVLLKTSWRNVRRVCRRDAGTQIS